jgi:hypothetical protein
VAAAARAHAAHRLLRAVDDGAQVDVQLTVHARLGLLLQRRDGHDPGVVDEDVDRAEAPLDAVEVGGEPGVVRHVEEVADGAVADLGSGGLGRGGVHVADRDAHPLAGQRVRERLADPPPSAGDHGDVTVQRARLLGHAVSSSSGKRHCVRT